ncbi:MAG TPA: hypothetical protein VLL97_14050 [Acidobacteriota bacterium]|nr:hypothetical protein [Acidobacteriota bacterium]
MKKPAVPLLLTDFAQQAEEVAMSHGMPGIRVQYHRGPVWGKTKEQIRRMIVEGPNPRTGRPVMQEIVEKFTRALTADDKRTGEFVRDKGPATFTGTAEELQQLFLERRFTDFMPIILPTEEKVAEMLKGTSHDPDKILGKMHPGDTSFETWTYTVRDAAVNAVMAGARPEHFPIILAIGSSGMTAVNVSDNGFMAGAVINGAIREEVGLNYEIGAMGPFALANTVIGRAWSLLSINGGNSGKVGFTYMGTVGNPMNAINIIIAENEENSPFEPFSVRRGFKKGENIVTLFMGWGVLSAKNWRATVWGPDMDYPKIIKDIYDGQDFMFGTLAVLSPPIANFVRDAGHETIEAFTTFVTGREPGQKPKPGGFGGPMGGQFNVVVTGGSNNNYFSMGGMVPTQSIKIDDWR